MKILDIYFKYDELFILTDGFEVTSPIFIDTLYNQENKYISFSVGSAITSQSIPEKEYEECLLKAKAMFEVLK